MVSPMPPRSRCASQLPANDFPVPVSLTGKTSRIGGVAQHCRCHRAVAQAEGEICRGVEGKTPRNREVAAQRAIALHQARSRGLLQVELHRGSREIPSDVLASGEEMVVVMIQRVHLEI